MRPEKFLPAPALGQEEMCKSKAFAQTYNKLSQFLKERRSLGEFSASQNNTPPFKLDLNGAIKETCEPRVNTTMNLFPKNKGKERDESTKDNLKSFDLFPLTTSSVAIRAEEPTKNKADQRELPSTNDEEHKAGNSASMTIFYGGRVLVFDDLPEDKAEEIMALASKGRLRPTSQTPPDNNASVTTQPIQSAVVQEQAAGVSDIPIARRTSLHRFMEKRKDRIGANAPYPLCPSTSQQRGS